MDPLSVSDSAVAYEILKIGMTLRLRPGTNDKFENNSCLQMVSLPWAHAYRLCIFFILAQIGSPLANFCFAAERLLSSCAP